VTAEAQFQPGERITHHEYGQGVVLDPVRDGYLRAFFGIGGFPPFRCGGNLRVPSGSYALWTAALSAAARLGCPMRRTRFL